MTTEDENQSKSRSETNAIQVPTDENSGEQGDTLKIKVYKKRWLILLLFTLFAMGNISQYYQYTIISKVMTEYFNVSSLAVTSTTVVFNLSVPIMLYPSTLMIKYWGLRYTMIIISMSTCLGTWIKYLGAAPNYFVLTLLGQTLVGICQIFVISLPAALVAKWFGSTEIAMATALSYMGLKVGVAVMSFLVSWLFVTPGSIEYTTKILRSLLLLQAIFCSCVVVLIIMFFKREPKLPPSKARALQKANPVKSIGFWNSLLRLFRNKNYRLLWIAQSLIFGQISTTTALISDLYIHHFEDGQIGVGVLSFIGLMSGFVGGLLFSKILDTTKKFKEIAIFLYLGDILSLIAFTVGICIEVKWIIFLSTAFYGFFGLSYLPISCELSAEITYPESESFCVAVLKLGDNLFAAIMTVISSLLFSNYGDVTMNTFLIILLSIGFILTLLTEDVQKRHSAGTNSSSHNNGRDY